MNVINQLSIAMSSSMAYNGIVSRAIPLSRNIVYKLLESCNYSAQFTSPPCHCWAMDNDGQSLWGVVSPTLPFPLLQVRGQIRRHMRMLPRERL